MMIRTRKALIGSLLMIVTSLAGCIEGVEVEPTNPNQDSDSDPVNQTNLTNNTPVDSDGDSILDGDDDCPGTPAGVPVDSHGCPEESLHIWPDDAGGYAGQAHNYNITFDATMNSMTTLYELDNLVANVTYLINWHVVNRSGTPQYAAEGNLTTDSMSNTGMAAPLHSPLNLSDGCYVVWADLSDDAGALQADAEFELCVFINASNGSGTENHSVQFIYIKPDSQAADGAVPYELTFPAPPMSDDSPYPMQQLCSKDTGSVADVWGAWVPPPFNNITSWKVENSAGLVLDMFVSEELRNLSGIAFPMVIFEQNTSNSGHAPSTLINQAIFDCPMPAPLDIVVGTEETNYFAFVDDVTQINATITLHNSTEGVLYEIDWSLDNGTVGEEFPDFIVDNGTSSWTGDASGTHQIELLFMVRGPNMAMGLEQGWYCLSAEVYEIIGASPSFGDADDACFIIEDPPDLDGDGYSVAVDCDDDDQDVHPGAEDVWNGIDDDCDLIVDPFIASIGNGTFDVEARTVGWVVKNVSTDYEGHSIYWLPGDLFAYRFIATPDTVFANGSGNYVHGFNHTPNILSTLSTLGLNETNVTITMTTMSLGTDTEGVEWSYDSTTKIETRYYDGGIYIFKLDGAPFLTVDVGILEYLDYSEYFGANAAQANVTMNGSTELGTINITADPITQPNLWRLAESFRLDLNGTIQMKFASQDAIIQESYNTDESGASALGVNSVISSLLQCQVGSSSCPNWIAAVFDFAATSRD